MGRHVHQQNNNSPSLIEGDTTLAALALLAKLIEQTAASTFLSTVTLIAMVMQHATKQEESDAFAALKGMELSADLANTQDALVSQHPHHAATQQSIWANKPAAPSEDSAADPATTASIKC